jgi:AraC-like DNA-binding protein
LFSVQQLQMALAGQTEESPYGPEPELGKAPEAIARTVASMPPERMFELMKQMKEAVINNPNMARQLLLENPQLAYALLQVGFSSPNSFSQTFRRKWLCEWSTRKWHTQCFTVKRPPLLSRSTKASQAVHLHRRVVFRHRHVPSTAHRTWRQQICRRQMQACRNR